PVIIAKDADIDLAVAQTIISKYRNAGQTCVCANRIIVHESIVDEFSEKLAEKVKELRVGNGMDQGTDIGPVINRGAYEKSAAQVQDAIDKGAEELVGNKYDVRDESRNYFVKQNEVKNKNVQLKYKIKSIKVQKC